MFDQPFKGGKFVGKVRPMTDLGQQIATELKEAFHGYTNRSERSQQATVGPSEVGTPCDRRLAMSLLRLAPVNPGGDNWASFVGTCVHAGLAEMLMWRDAGSGRHAVELPLTFPSPAVPKGTGDWLDRTVMAFLDHKAMGQWSLDKLKTEGPSPTYRVQVHTYGFGAALRGEKVRHVAIVGWPRVKGNLDDLYVWTEPYDPSIARKALERADRIGEAVEGTDPGWVDTVYRGFPINNSDCKYCPFHLPGANKSVGGVCNGRA